MNYPTELVQTPEQLPEAIDQTELNASGLFVMRGLDIALAQQLVERSREPHVALHCLNDPGSRFGSVSKVEKWQGKGRLALPLVKIIGEESPRLVGMGWTGPQKPKANEPQIAGAEITFAFRLYEEVAGQKKAFPYIQVILAAHDHTYGSKGVWLETWGDNQKALTTYKKSGFIEVTRVKSVRESDKQELDRVYMTLGNLAAQ